MSQVVDITSSGNVADALKLRMMGFQDIRAMRDIFCRSIDDSFDYFPVDYRNKLRRQHNLPRLAKACLSPKAHFMLLAHGAEDIGYCMVRFQQSKAYLFWMYVDPGSRGIGAGELLLQAALKVADSYGKDALQLVTHDKEQFYAKYGFTSLRCVAGLVGGVDMVIMEYKI